MSDLPEKVNVMWVRTYDVKAIIKEIADFEEIDTSEVTMEEIMDLIYNTAADDMAASSDDPDFIIQDEEGEDLSW